MVDLGQKKVEFIPPFFMEQTHPNTLKHSQKTVFQRFNYFLGSSSKNQTDMINSSYIHYTIA